MVDSSQTIGNNSNTNGNYGIHDLDSGDETDNANYPRKQVPHWALGMNFNLVKLSLMFSDWNLNSFYRVLFMNYISSRTA